jgi:hypothetical protein
MIQADLFCDYAKPFWANHVPRWELRINPAMPGGDVGIFFDHLLLWGEAFLESAYTAYNKRVAVLMEPRRKYPHNYAFVEEHAGDFNVILTCNRALARAYGNAVYEPFGTGWTLGAQPPRKTDLVGMVISDKATKGHMHEGYRLRWQAARILEKQGLPVFGSGVGEYIPRGEVIGPAMFAVEAENCLEACYFTEKLIDCFLQRTVPIYFGPPCVGEYFDIRGMLNWFAPHTLLEHVRLVRAKGHELYRELEPFIKQNYQAALDLAMGSDRWLQAIEELL